MKFLIPPSLQPGDLVALVATARWVTPEQLQPAVDLITKWGYRIWKGSNVHEQNFQLAGTDEERAGEFQKALDNQQVKAIVVVRGGYGTVRLIDRLDFQGFMQSPKWVCGYSDITVLHAELNRRGVATIHSTMPVSFPDATTEAISTLERSLNGKLDFIEWDLSGNDPNGTEDFSLPPLPVYGGNLSVVCSLLGSPTFAPSGEHILFLEDVDEMLYHMDRMSTALKRSGVLRHTRALLVGGLTQMRDNVRDFGFPVDNAWGYTAEATLAKLGADLQIPVRFGFPAGHQNDNRAFYMGRPAVFTSSGKHATLRFA